MGTPWAAAIALTLTLSPVMGQESLNLKAQFLDRGDLPPEFWFPLLELDFVVVKLEVENLGEEDWVLEAANLQILDVKKKKLEQVGPSEITPRIVNSKAFKRSASRPSGQLSRPPVLGPPYIAQPIPQAPGNASIISIQTVQQVRSTLEEHQIADRLVASGERTEGYLYLKSKKPASRLSGSTLVLGQAAATAITGP